MNLGSVHGFVHGLVYGLVHGLVYGTWFMVSLIMFFLNMVDYPVFFPSRSTRSGPDQTLADFLYMHKFVIEILTGISSTGFNVKNLASGRPNSLKTKGLPRIHQKHAKFGDLGRVSMKNNK